MGLQLNQPVSQPTPVAHRRMQYKTGGGAAGGAAEVRRSAQPANPAVSSKPNMQIDFFKSTILNLLLYELDLSKLSQIVIINSVMYDAHFFSFTV